MADRSETSSPALRFDIIAGLTAAAVVLPKAMAYATVAGLPVSVGLYTAFVPMIVYALLGTSRVLSVSSTTTLAILTGAELGSAVPDGDPGKLVTAVATLTALTGALLIVASFLRLGFIANFISTPVLTGFKAGIGLVIVLDQIPKLLGIHITKEGFFRDILSVAHHVSETSLITVTIGVVALLALDSHGTIEAPLSGTAYSGGRRHCGIMVLWPERLGGGDRRRHPTIPSFDHTSEHRSCSAAIAWSLRHRLDELYRDECRSAGFCSTGRTPRSSRIENFWQQAPPTFRVRSLAPCRLVAARRRRPSSALSVDERRRHHWLRPQRQQRQC